MSTSSTLGGKGSFARGIHPADQKHFAADAPIEVLVHPASVAVPLLQHIGAPCEAIVKSRQEVILGEKIGEAKGFVSAPVHASIAGACKKESVATLPNGRHVPVIPITAGEDQPATDEIFADVLGGDWQTENLSEYDGDTIRQAVREAGIVGQGGAAFPTHVKLTRNDKKPIDTLLVNGCECEPYLTADYRMMLEAPRPILSGAMLAAQACGADRVVIAVEDNKPQAIEALRKAAAGTGVEVVGLHTKYPMGGEKQTVLASLGREIPTGGLPLDVGVVVVNVGTAAAIARAVLRSRPLTHRVVTVSGAGIREPKNLLVPIGTSYQVLLDACGGLTDDCARVVAGGPMMGFAVADFETPVTKGTSGLTCLTAQDVRKAAETQCVRCGRCVDVCPLHLVPTKIALAARHKDWDLAKRYYMTACMECGCCGYICPASLPLVQLIRMGKAEMPRD